MNGLKNNKMTKEQKQEVFERNIREFARMGITSHLTAYLAYKAEIDSRAEQKVAKSLLVNSKKICRGSLLLSQ